MDVLCTADLCPVILNATCVFYEGNTLLYTGITTNDNLQTALQKIDAKFGDAMVGYTFTNGVFQSAAGAPVGLGGNLTTDVTIGGNYTLTFAGNVRAAKHITTGGTASQFVKGDGTLDSTAYQAAGNYITALTGDVIAAGPGSVAASLAVVNSNPGTYGSGTRIPVVTVDTKGRVTALTTTAIVVPSGILSFVGDVFGSGTTGSATTLTLSNVNTNVYANNTFLKFKVNAKGLVTGAAPITHVDIEGVLGYVPTPETRKLSINGVQHDLQSDIYWEIATGVGSVTASAPLSSTGGATPNISITKADATTDGYLDNVDWVAFNAKQAALNGTGLVRMSGTTVTYDNTAYTPQSRTLTINGTTYDLSADRSWTINSMVYPEAGIAVSTGTAWGTSITDNSANWNTAYTERISSSSSPLSILNHIISIAQAGASADGYLSSTDWNTFNNKQPAGSYVTTSRTISTTGPLQGGGDLSADRTLSITQSGASTDGYLSSTDWNTFNNKQASGNYITDLTGEATASGPGSATVTLSTPAVTGKLLTGVNITGGTVVATDTILEAFGKVQNQINGLIGGSIYQGVWNASTNTPTLTSSVGTNGYYYIVNVAGSTNLNGITDWKVGDWAIFHDTIWQKVDNTDAVVSVNGYTGAVSLVSSDIPEGLTNLYYTPARARTAISLTTTGTSGAATYDNITGVLNVPIYTPDLSGYVPITRTLSINGTTYDLSANRSWTVSGTMPAGGTAGQILSKIDATDYNTEWIDNYATQVKNEVKLGATLAKGTPVYESGADGTNIIVSAASNTTEATSSKTFGLLETGGVTNDFVKCVTYGLLAGLDTSAANAAGDPVWLGPNGTLLYGLVNKPYAPAHMVYIGVVTRKQANNGEIFVNIQNGFEMDELHNVSARNPDNNAILAYSTATSLWEKNTIAGVLGYTPEQPLTFSSPLVRTVNAISIPAATGSVNGYLSSTDWTTFNNKLSPATAASTYVPYTSATADVDLGAYKLAAQDISYNGSAGGGFFRLKTQSQAAIPQLNNVKLSAGQTSDLVISSDSYNSTLVTSSNTADRTYTFPNASGTIALTSDIVIYTLPIATASVLGGVKIGGGVSIDAGGVISVSTSYLPLAGGTLTGAVTGTRLTLSQNSADITLSIGNAGTGRAFSVLGTSYFSADIQLGYATNAILKTTALGVITSAIAGTDYVVPSGLSSYLPLAGGTMSGILYSTYNTATGRPNLGFNTAKTVIGNYHIQNGGGPGNDNGNQAAITFQGGVASEAQAGIYVLNNGSYGTSMGFATTNSYATGPQLFMTATNDGVVNFPRARPTYAGNIILDASNYNSYSPALTGTGASGTWAISISGNAATATTATNSGQLNGLSSTQLFNNMGNVHGTYTNANDVGGFGFRYLQGNTNGPNTGATQYYGVTVGLGNEYAWGTYASQFYWNRVSTGGSPYVSVRFQENGSWTGWFKIYAGYADTAGTATSATTATTATNSTQLNGWGYTSYAYRASGTGYYQIDTWMQFNGTHGIYWPNHNGAHIYANTDGSYGSIRIDGTRNGWKGIYFDSGNTLMMNANESGHYQQATGWKWRWYAGQIYVSRGTNGGGTEYIVVDAGNISSYTSGNTNSISSATGGAYNWTGIQYFVSNRNTPTDSPPLQAYSNNGSGAIMSFHRGGYYAVNFGLDSDNVMRIGGWSAGVNRWQLDMSGNQTVAGNVTAGVDVYSNNGWFYSYNNAGWYNSTYGQGLRQSKGNVSYGNVITVGENFNGWSGYNTTNTYVTCFMQNSSGTHGWYQEGGGNGWTAFYNFGNQCWGLGNDATDPGYSLHITKYGGSNQGWIIWSDRRIKENIKTIDNALDKVLSLRGVYYNKIDDPNKERCVGYIAQEVMEVVPELVVYSEELDIYNMNYAPMVSMLTEAMKEQQAQIETLKEQVQTLLNHINNGV